MSAASLLATNRRLRDREIFWDWKDEWKVTADYLVHLPLVRKDSERSERADSENSYESLVLSQLLEAVRSYFTENPRD